MRVQIGGEGGLVDGEEVTAEQRAALGHLEGKEHMIRVSSIKGLPYITPFPTLEK